MARRKDAPSPPAKRPTRRRSVPTKSEQAKRAREQQDAERQAAIERAVVWATTHGAPLKLLDGWNPDTGEWTPTSPVGQLIGWVANGSHIGPAGRVTGLPEAPKLFARGAEFALDAAEDRAYIPIDQRPFVDFYRRVATVEALSEVQMVSKAYTSALKDDADTMLRYLGRRWPSRWREQTGLAVGPDDRDEFEAAITAAIEDPNVAARLAEVADAVAGRDE